MLYMRRGEGGVRRGEERGVLHYTQVRGGGDRGGEEREVLHCTLTGERGALHYTHVKGGGMHYTQRGEAGLGR